jgi:hypothetical protein
VIDDRLDNVRLDAELVRVSRKAAAQIVRGPMRQRMAKALRNPLNERLFGI